MDIIFYFVIIIFSAIIHEYAHGAMAEYLGDKTARYAGRLTLNPLAHIDLQGSIILPLLMYMMSGGQFLFAYAKPVPYNPYNLRNQKWGPALVGLAGPLANLFLAISFVVLIRLFVGSLPTTLLSLFYIIARANVSLAVFNLLPVPPLDGSKILYALFPDSWRAWQNLFDRYGWVGILLLIFFASPLITWIVNKLMYLFFI